MRSLTLTATVRIGKSHEKRSGNGKRCVGLFCTDRDRGGRSGDNKDDMKILNLYAGIGGNRKLWGDEHEITAVEIDEEIAAIYKSHFPNDTVIVGDAHQYLLNHFKEFDFIWSSFPCTSHTRMNVNFNRVKFPDLRLYEEIIFLQTFYKGLYCVENVIPYYDPLIRAQQYNRHLFWCNFKIATTDKRNPPKQIQNIIAQKTKRKRKTYDGDIVNIKSTQPHFGFDLSRVNLKTRKDKVLRNCVDPEVGLMILECALGKYETKSIQPSLFA
jgi:DNA (cytosine-5)-methyltransferase 1